MGRGSEAEREKVGNIFNESRGYPSHKFFDVSAALLTRSGSYFSVVRTVTVASIRLDVCYFHKENAIKGEYYGRNRRYEEKKT